MTYQLSRWSVLALFPALALALNCSTDPDSTFADETDTDEFSQFRASLGSSKFEIEDDANLTQNGDPPALDWASPSVILDTKIGEDGISGPNDSSYGGGVKEDTACPAVGTGSIPNNKSDIVKFGVFQEPGTPSYLHLFWTRVQDPSGTTLLDFELNQSDELCPGDNPHSIRTDGDILVEYRLAANSSTATIKLREWENEKWGNEQNLTDKNLATGTINKTLIPGGEIEELDELDPRTFGEASIDLTAIFDPGKCTSFGSAFVKSRSSDTFSSALKDLIPPIPINVTNCGKVIIRKVTDPASSDKFEFTHTVETNPASGTQKFELSNGGVEEFTDVVLNDGDTPQYEITEAASELYTVSINCDASSGVSEDLVIGDKKVTFVMDEPSDVVDCTFTNTAQPLTDITVSVDSRSVDLMGNGRTSSVITCDPPGATADDPFQTLSNGDGTLKLPGLLAGEYSCKVVISDN